MSLSGKVAAITGAGTGIGRAIALALAAEKVRVAVTDITLDWAEQVAQEIRHLGGEAVAYRLDVTRKIEAEQVVQALVERWGRVDIWCNNAGISRMNHFWECDEAEWDVTMEVNAKGVFLCSQVVAKQMMRQEPMAGSERRGKIINTASMAGKRGNAPFLAPYVASKFAVVGLTQAIAGELAPYDITVNAVCPGYVRTSMQEREVGWEAHLRNTTPDAVRQLYIDDTPLRRLEKPEDVAGVVVFLASPAADFITGEAINVNGGAWMD